MDSRIRTKIPSRRQRMHPLWKHGSTPVVGLIGGIGSGKSLVAAFLGEQGAFVLDADKVGHTLLNQRPVRDEVISRFGSKILTVTDESPEEPLIDRRALGAIVFSDPSARLDLEAIVHPRMRRTFEKAIARVVRQGKAKAVVLDAAILFEAGWQSLCDRVVYVDSPRDQRLARLAAQRGWTAEILAAREQAQWPAEKKMALADAIVQNDNGIDMLESHLLVLWSWLVSSASTPVPGQFRAERHGPDPPSNESMPSPKLS